MKQTNRLLLYATIILFSLAPFLSQAGAFIIHDGVVLHTNNATVTVGSALSVSDLKLSSGSLRISGTTWAITPLAGTVVITLTSFSPSSTTIKFTADGKQATYEWDWSTNRPYVTQTSGKISVFTIYSFVDNVESKELKIDITATGTTTTKIQCGSLGNPTTVTGASSFSYSTATKVLTVTVQHSSPATITLSWRTSSTNVSLSAQVMAGLLVIFVLILVLRMLTTEEFDLREIIGYLFTIAVLLIFATIFYGWGF